jgi:hypothetical protein
LKKEGGVVRIEGCVVKKCKSVVKTLKTVVKINCIIECILPVLGSCYITGYITKMGVIHQKLAIYKI